MEGRSIVDTITHILVDIACGIHDDSKLAREPDPRLAHCGTLRNGESPILQF